MSQLFHLSKNAMVELNELGVGQQGVVQKNYANAMSENSKILVVGLGGMGLSSVHELKKTLIDRIGTLRSSDIQFIAFDTSKEDLSSRTNAGPLTVSETHLLYSPSLAGVMQQPEHLRPQAFQAPMPPKGSSFNPTFDGNGAGQVRLSGRLSLMDPTTHTGIVQTLKRAITELGDFTRRKLEVHVICGTGGGTGSGLCVDMPYIIRHVADTLYIPEANRRIFGYVYMPNVYDTVPHANLDNIYRNGYAALKEIDYYMNIPGIGETFDAIYPDGPYSTTAAIFDNCTLIGGYPDGAIVVRDTKKAAITACVENLVNRVTHTVAKKNAYDRGGKDDSMAGIFTSQAFTDNVAAQLKVVLANGAGNFHEGGNYKYNYVGSSSLKFPTESIIEYFVGEVFKKTMDKLEANATRVTQKDVDDFARQLVAPTDLIRSTMNDFNEKLTQTLEGATWNRDVVRTRDIDHTLTVMLNAAYRSFDEQNDLISNARARATTKAQDIFKDAAKGPYFLARLLKAVSGEGDGIVGYFEKLNNYAGACASTIDRLNESLVRNKQQRDRLADTMQRFGHFNSNLDNYKTILREIWRDELQLKLYQKMANTLYRPSSEKIGVCYQITELLNGTFLTYTDMLTYIGEILASNAAEEKAIIDSNDTPGSIFSLNEEVFDALKNRVRNNLRTKLGDFGDIEISNFATALLNEVVTHQDQWVLNGYNPLAHAPVAVRVREFVYNYKEFQDVTRKSFTDYFEEAYGNETEAVKSKIVRTLADRLNDAAAPMCNKQEAFSWQHVNVLCHRFMVLPSKMDGAWGELFSSHFGSANENVLLSPDQNAMYNYTLYAAMPMWLHASLPKYEEQYNKLRKDAGFHINESAMMDPPYVDYPPLMVPQQWHRADKGLLKYENKYETEYRTNLKKIIADAIACGVLVPNDQNCYVLKKFENRPTAEQIDAFFEEYAEDPNNFGSDGLLMGGAYLQAALESFYPCKTMDIYQVRSMRADNDENLLELVRRQMKLTGALKSELAYYSETIIKRLNEINDEIIRKKRMKDFSTWLLFGVVFSDENKRWFYRLGDESYPLVTAMRLRANSNPFMQSLGEYMELAAFKTFFESAKAADHSLIMADQINEKIDFLEFNSGDSDLAKTIKANYAAFTDKATRVRSLMARKVASGRSLSKDENAIKEFYENLLTNLESMQDFVL